MSDKNAPKPPKVTASKEEHRRFAKEVDDYEPYKQEPPGGVEIDPIPEGEGPVVEGTDEALEREYDKTEAKIEEEK